MKRSSFLAPCICLLAWPCCYAQLDSDLIGYWQFDVNGLDASVSEHELELVGNPGFIPGLFGCALNLTGNAGQFARRFDNDTIYDLGNQDFTIQVWVNFSSVSGEQTLIEKFTGGAGPGYTLTKLSNNRIQFFASGLGVVNSPVVGLETGIWYHVVLRRAGNDVQIFLDGNSVVQSTLTATITASPNPLLIGERHNSQQFPVRGAIDEVAFWSRAVTDNEILDLFNDRTGLSMVMPPKFIPGDVNQDGMLNLLDVQPFVDLLSSGVYQLEADMNQDCIVNLLDVDGFIDALSG